MAEPTLKQKTAKGFFWGGMNSGIQQVLNVVFGVVLARILNAEDYGLVGMLGIFMGIATVLFDSGFGVALINRKKIQHDDYNSVFSGSRRYINLIDVENIEGSLLSEFMPDKICGDYGISGSEIKSCQECLLVEGRKFFEFRPL